jgi:hypothetical protein
MAKGVKMKIGDRARFTGSDQVFHYGEREGKVGTIVLDANLDPHGSNFGGGTCGWTPLMHEYIDGKDAGVYITALEDLTLEAK